VQHTTPFPFGNRAASKHAADPAPRPDLDDIQRGLAAAEFEAYFQPQFRLRDGSLFGAEVLARWNHPQWGVLAPDRFLPAMEASHDADLLCGQLFDLMLAQGLSLQRELASRSLRLELAFNVPPALLAAPDFATRIGRMVADAGLPTDGLTFELTERGGIDDPRMDRILDTILRLRMMGCGVSMDDLGQGHSSLARLCQFPFSQIKLDGSFVRGLDHCRASRAVATAALALAHELDADLVAEGVETPSQRRRLIAMGCQIGQGFGLSPPLRQPDLLRRMAEDGLAAAPC